MAACQRFGLGPSAVRAELGLPALGPRRLSAWTTALSHVAALEEAEAEITRDEGNPTVEQRHMMQAVERDYVAREGLGLYVEESDGPVLTPTDEGYVLDVGAGAE